MSECRVAVGLRERQRFANVKYLAHVNSASSIGETYSSTTSRSIYACSVPRVRKYHPLHSFIVLISGFFPPRFYETIPSCHGGKIQPNWLHIGSRVANHREAGHVGRSGIPLALHMDSCQLGSNIWWWILSRLSSFKLQGSTASVDATRLPKPNATPRSDPHTALTS